MDFIYVKVDRKKVGIDRSCFVDLLDTSSIKELSSYQLALTENEIMLADLKNLAQKAGVPYPLFFAPKEILQVQLKDYRHNIYSKIAGKDEIRLSTRGKFQVEDVRLILNDLSRKQEFLKNRLLTNEKPNTFVGRVVKHIKENRSSKEIAEAIRQRLGIDLSYMRRLSKGKVLDYICNCAEAVGIFVSFSSYNYMPQNINKEVELSGICLKDKKFPFVFINTRDGDENPKILETSGRQIFTLVSMVTCVAMNRFILSIKTDKKGEGVNKTVFQIVGELLIPAEDAQNLKITNLEELKTYSEIFKVTPSMLLMRLRELNRMDASLGEHLQQKLSDEVKGKQVGPRRQPRPVDAYAKYNGTRFSKEVVRAYASHKITQEEFKNVLFRRGKMEQGLIDNYSKKFN